MGLVAKKGDKVDSTMSQHCTYYLIVDNPFAQERLPCTNPAVWVAYDSAQEVDLCQLISQVHDFVRQGRSTFTVSTKAIYRRNLEKMAEQLRPKGYACKIWSNCVYLMTISPAE